MRVYSYEISDAHMGWTVEAYLRCHHYSSRVLTKLKKSPTGLLLNGEHTRTIDRLQAGDILRLELADEINDTRLARWNCYYEQLKPLEEKGEIELPVIPEGCIHNGHMFYIKAKDLKERTELIRFLKEKDILSVFHYVPLHSAPAGVKFGRFHGEDKYTTAESERLLRLPMFYQLTKDQADYIEDKVKEFYGA